MNPSFLQVLQDRFENNPHRHPDIVWSDLEKKLQNSQKINILEKMESTGGEVDVVGFDTETQEYIFMDCSRESPAGRRSLCYDQVALDGRKENKPKGSYQVEAILLTTTNTCSLSLNTKWSKPFSVTN